MKRLRRLWKRVQAKATSIYICRNVQDMLDEAAIIVSASDCDLAYFLADVAHNLRVYGWCAGTFRGHLLSVKPRKPFNPIWISPKDVLNERTKNSSY